MTRYGRGSARMPLLVRLLPLSVRRRLMTAVTSAILDAIARIEAVPPARPLKPLAIDVWATPDGEITVRVQERF